LNLVVWMHEAASLYSRQVCKIGNHVHEDVDALEEDGLVDKLVVVVEEDGGAVEGRESNGRYPNLPDVARVCGCRKNLWRYLQVVFLKGCT